MTKRKPITDATIALQTRGVTTRRTLLVAISQLGEAMIAEIFEATGFSRQLIEQQVTQLYRLGCIARCGKRKVPRGRPRLTWRVTDLGQRAIREPILLVLRVTGRQPETEAQKQAKLERERHKEAHARHVELQRLMGLPEDLIHARLAQAWGEVPE